MKKPGPDGRVIGCCDSGDPWIVHPNSRHCQDCGELHQMGGMVYVSRPKADDPRYRLAFRLCLECWDRLVGLAALQAAR